MIDERYEFKDEVLKVKIADKWKNIELKQYKFLEEIGRGANAVVIKAQHLVTERIDAIKIWLPHKSSKDGNVSLEQYLREVRKISNLKDENIVTVYGAEYNDGVHICIMEYIEGISLKEVWKKNENLVNKIKVCLEILQTVENYQQAGIIHGDLHGGNIIIDKNEHIHIIDFGTSLFGNCNQSKARESYLIYDLVKKILKEDFKKELFTVKNYSISSKIENNDDTRIHEPLLITKTMLQFVKLRDIKNQTIKMSDYGILIEYCEIIAQGIYFNLNKVYSELLSWSDLKFVKLSFWGLLHTNIESTILESSGDNVYELEYITLYIYYEVFKSFKEEISREKCKKLFFENYNGFLSDEKYDEYFNDLYKSNYQSYIEYREHLAKSLSEQNLYYIDTRIRTLLFNIIQTHYKKDQLTDILYNIWKRLNEIKVNKKLYSEIASLDMGLKKYID